jgi:hypothetical protein
LPAGRNSSRPRRHRPTAACDLVVARTPTRRQGQTGDRHLKFHEERAFVGATHPDAQPTAVAASNYHGTSWEWR